MADSHLRLEQQDLFTANQVIHLKPIIGGELMTEFAAANPFVRRVYPNAAAPPRQPLVAGPRSRCEHDQTSARDPVAPAGADCRSCLPAELRLAPSTSGHVVAISRAGAAAIRLPQAAHAESSASGDGSIRRGSERGDCRGGIGAGSPGGSRRATLSASR